MRDQQASQAMRDQDHVAGMIGDGPSQGANPFGAIRVVPIALLYPLEPGIALLPIGLPMARSGICVSGQYEELHGKKGSGIWG
jgi:hypothetical protein